MSELGFLAKYRMRRDGYRPDQIDLAERVLGQRMKQDESLKRIMDAIGLPEDVRNAFPEDAQNMARDAVMPKAPDEMSRAIFGKQSRDAGPMTPFGVRDRNYIEPLDGAPMKGPQDLGANLRQRAIFESAPTEVRNKFVESLLMPKTSDPIKLGKDDRLYSSDASEMLVGPMDESPSDPGSPDVKEFFDEETGRKYKAQWNADTRSWERVGGVEAPPAAGNTSFTADQNKAAGFYKRMEDAGSVIGKLEADPNFGVSGANRLLSDWSPNALRDENYQMYRQAQEDWVTANLRKESGAVIGAEEMEQEISKYFPQVGDGPQTIRQKANSRRNAELSMRQSAGPAYENLMGMAQPVEQTQNAATEDTFDTPPPGSVFLPDGRVQTPDGDILEWRP